MKVRWQVTGEAKELIQKMESQGLTSYKAAELNRQSDSIAKDPIAIASCRIMKDFRPVEEIVRSLVDEADSNRLERYTCAALATYCCSSGVSYQILAACFSPVGVDRQFNARDMLPLTYFDLTAREYVIPTNPILGERVLKYISEHDQSFMLEVFSALGASVAPYVNRDAVLRRTPEARLSARLLNFDDAVADFIPSKSEEFYLRMKRFWDWNSRYWEQFALLKLDRFRSAKATDKLVLLSQALSHARHAVRLERHPLGLTTLGRILIEEMVNVPERADQAFKEGFDYLNEAIRQEGLRNRIAIHPYTTLFSGVNLFLKSGGSLRGSDKAIIEAHLEAGERLFSTDTNFLILCKEVRRQAQMTK